MVGIIGGCFDVDGFGGIWELNYVLELNFFILNFLVFGFIILLLRGKWLDDEVRGLVVFKLVYKEGLWLVFMLMCFGIERFEFEFKLGNKELELIFKLVRCEEWFRLEFKLVCIGILEWVKFVWCELGWLKLGFEFK